MLCHRNAIYSKESDDEHYFVMDGGDISAAAMACANEEATIYAQLGRFRVGGRDGCTLIRRPQLTRAPTGRCRGFCSHLRFLSRRRFDQGEGQLYKRLRRGEVG